MRRWPACALTPLHAFSAVHGDEALRHRVSSACITSTSSCPCLLQIPPPSPPRCHAALRSPRHWMVCVSFAPLLAAWLAPSVASPRVITASATPPLTTRQGRRRRRGRRAVVVAPPRLELGRCWHRPSTAYAASP